MKLSYEYKDDIFTINIKSIDKLDNNKRSL